MGGESGLLTRVVEATSVITAGTFVAATLELIAESGDAVTHVTHDALAAAGRGCLLFVVAALAVQLVSRLSSLLRSQLVRLAVASFLGAALLVVVGAGWPLAGYLAAYGSDLGPVWVVIEIVGVVVVRPLIFGLVVFALALSGVMLVRGLRVASGAG
jgi:hypothetical protein